MSQNRVQASRQHQLQYLKLQRVELVTRNAARRLTSSGERPLNRTATIRCAATVLIFTSLPFGFGSVAAVYYAMVTETQAQQEASQLRNKSQNIPQGSMANTG